MVAQFSVLDGQQLVVSTELQELQPWGNHCGNGGGAREVSRKVDRGSKGYKNSHFLLESLEKHHF